MDQSAPAPRRKLWFPYIKLTVFMIVVSTGMYFFLTAFDPQIERDPKEWEQTKPKVSKQVEFFFRLLGNKKKEKTDEK